MKPPFEMPLELRRGTPGYGILIAAADRHGKRKVIYCGDVAIAKYLRSCIEMSERHEQLYSKKQ